ncbi:MAG: response regulator [Gammaproteobacteria bacterium]|nr:response regulator [Gammaproteobacteria bacterium]
MSIRAKLFLPIIIALVLFGTIMHWYWLPQYLRQQTEHFTQTQSRELNLLATAITPALLAGDLAQVHSTLNETLALRPFWRDIRLFNNNGQQLFPLVNHPVVRTENLISLSALVKYEARPYGKLQLGTDVTRVLREETASIHYLEVFAMVFLSSIAVLTLVIQDYWVRRPLNLLHVAVRQLAKGNTEAPIPTVGNDETGELARAFAAMRHAVLKREQGLRAVLDHIVDGVIGMDTHGIIQSFNPAAEKIFGYPAAEVIGQNIRQLMPEPDHNQRNDYLQAYLQGSEHKIIGNKRETQGRRKDGQVFVMELAISEYQVGVERFFTGLVRDITSRKCAEEAMRQQYQLLDCINQSQSRFIAQSEPKVLFAGLLNDLLHLTGSSIGFIGEVKRDSEGAPYLHTHTISNIAWDEASRQFYAENIEAGLEFRNLNTLFGRVLVTGQAYISNDPLQDEYRGGLPVGHPPLHAFMGLPIQHQGELLAMVGLANRQGGYDAADLNFLKPLVGTYGGVISAWRNAQRLRFEEERLSLALRATEAGLWEWDIQHGTTFYDARLITLLGFEHDDQTGGGYAWGSIHPEDVDSVMRELNDHLDGNTAQYSSEHRKRHQHGHWEWVHEHGRVITRDMKGEPLRLIGTLTIITARREANRMLEEARDQALAAARAKSEFLATMSHEIRTPMNGVLGMAQILSTTALTPEQQHYLETIIRSGRALLTVINDVLDFSKIEAGKLNLEAIVFDLGYTAHDVCHLLMNNATEKGLELILRYAPDSPRWFTGDVSRLRQVLINLISNAIKFTHQGYVLLDIHYKTDQLPAPQVVIKVIDTGIGIAPEVIPRLFQSFTQADSSTTRRYGGTGLGLAICKNIIEVMGGRVGIESQPGRGSTFWFEIPLTPAPTPTQLSKANLTGVRVLAVDDFPLNRLVLQEQLSALGMRVTTASDAHEALHVLQRSKQLAAEEIELVILDYLMPEINGEQLAKMIHAKADFAHLPLIILTSSALRGETKRFEEAGFSAYLTKPALSEQLAAVLAVVLGSARHGEKSRLITAHSVAEDTTTTHSAVHLTGRVLLVEDTVVNQMVVHAMLEKAGLEVVIAENGAVAVQQWEDQTFDLILMDCQMPIMDGYRATELIRRAEQSRGTHIPIIALTANAMAEDRAKCLAAGMDDYLAKPFEAGALSNILMTWITNPRQRKVAG